MKLNKKQFKTWINALRSGKYKQTTGTLQDTAGYCCLGLACKVLIKEEDILKETHEVHMSPTRICNVGMIHGGVPGQQPKAPKWLQNISQNFGYILYKADEVRTPNSMSLRLTYVNDVEKLSFDEIADMLELVYIHKALD